ncbi:hypothetical protein [Mycobacterium aquaticum]|uniref:hypothetical protein n=1 Tax=Mycobacterium aquaticum TaxID=1927124 RepID=UPI00114FADBA|nr:hypothetical protein [Mycobacterium aquaticum]
MTGGTFRGGLVAINAFYEWAERRYGVMNPVERVAVPVAGGRRQVDSYRAAPRVGRDRDVKWLDPGGFTRWRDVGLCGLDLSGRELSWWRGRSPQRDCAFVGGLYGTGLRLTEWASMLVLELPFDASDRAFVTGQLAAACAKGGVRRKYWMPYPALSAVLSYGEGERAAAVRRAQAVGRYDGVADRLVVRRQLGGRRIEVVDVLGRSSAVSLDALLARLDNLAEAHQRLTSGEHVSGPAAELYRDRVHNAQRFTGHVLATHRDARKLYTNPDLQIFPGVGMTCVFDPQRAACRFSRDDTDSRRTPDLSDCQPYCANIARTDGDIDVLREHVQRLAQLVDDPLAPEPRTQRDRHELRRLRTMVLDHDNGRTAPHD